MGFLQRFLRVVLRDGGTSNRPSSFDKVSERELEAHLEIARYGDFELTDAVRPSYDLQVVPRQGFRHDIFRDEETRVSVPVLMVAASRERLFDLFLDLLNPLGQEVDVVLETSHHRRSREHDDLYREHIDLPVLKSILCSYEDLLLNDGCTGVAVLNPQVPLEVQFDEHKMIVVYGTELGPFEEVLQEHGILCDEELRFITEAEHVHSSSEQYYEEFTRLRTELGIDSMFA